MTLDDLSSEDRLRLMRFVCAFAWADLDIADTERDFVRGLIAKLNLNEDETAEVEHYLTVPPRPEDVDPTDVPAEHRQLFLTSILGGVGADGVVDEREVENLSLLKQLLR